MSPDERRALLRLDATLLDYRAAHLRLAAGIKRATAALSGFTDAVRDHEDRALFEHPDVMDMDLYDVAWNPGADDAR